MRANPPPHPARPATPPTFTIDMNAHRIKWGLLAAYWLVQAVVHYIFAVVWFVAGSNVHGPGGRLFGNITDLEELIEHATYPYFVVATLITITVVTLAQAALVLPVARPSAKRSRGTPVWISMALAAVAIAALCVSAVWAADSIAFAIGSRHDESSDWVMNWRYAVAGGIAAWIPATLLLVAFARRSAASDPALSREDLLARTAALVFKGTMVKVAAIIPLDVMVRRRTNCYCDTGTFMALTVCATVGLFALGPAIFLPLLARRRAMWHHGRCEVCGYDMQGNLKAERCPECGAGWKPQD